MQDKHSFTELYSRSLDDAPRFMRLDYFSNSKHDILLKLSDESHGSQEIFLPKVPYLYVHTHVHYRDTNQKASKYDSRINIKRQSIMG
jgi:hypothetical protein